MTPRHVRWALLALVGLGILATGLMVSLQQGAGKPVLEAPRSFGPVPEFELLDQRGRTVTRSDLDGEPWVVDFIFTRCALSCPRLTSRMMALGANLPDLRRVSITVDPEYDTPEVLASYALAYGISDPRWLFLSGQIEAIRELVIGGFKLAVVNDPPAEVANPQEPILHSNRFVLVDARGEIRGYYEATSAADFERLVRDVEMVRSEGPPQTPKEDEAVISLEECRKEVEELHQFFQDWFVGSLEQTDDAFERFAGVLADDFTIIGPGGLEFAREGVLDQVRGAYGSRAEGEFAIWIEDVRIRQSGGDQVVLTYEEWQRSGAEERGRVSTAVFGRREGTPNGIEWRHVQETWLPDSSDPGEN